MRHQVGDHALRAAETEFGVIDNVTNFVGMPINAKFNIRVVDDPTCLDVQLCHGLGVKGVRVEVEIDDIGRFGSELSGQSTDRHWLGRLEYGQRARHLEGLRCRASCKDRYKAY